MYRAAPRSGKAVEYIGKRNCEGNLFDEEPEVAEQDDREGVMERQAGQPQPLGLPVRKPVPFIRLGLEVPEQ
jgi:hypothetical protein